MLIPVYPKPGGRPLITGYTFPEATDTFWMVTCWCRSETIVKGDRERAEGYADRHWLGQHPVVNRWPWLARLRRYA